MSIFDEFDERERQWLAAARRRARKRLALAVLAVAVLAVAVFVVVALSRGSL